MTNPFKRLLAEAIDYFSRAGFGEDNTLDYWQGRLRLAIGDILRSWNNPNDAATIRLSSIYSRAFRPGRGGVEQFHGNLSRLTIQSLEPSLRPLLTARIYASAQLIKLNRDQAIEDTLRRFAGWVSSIPPGGSPRKLVQPANVVSRISKPLQQCSYQERRLLIDQGHKLISSINQVIAEGNGAIAEIWHSHWRDASYDYRPDHKARDGKVYLIRNSWAHQNGLVKPDKNGYIEDITQPGEEVFCRCYAEFLYALSELPADMLTRKGKELLKNTRGKNASSE